jgi:hypothetical protein
MVLSLIVEKDHLVQDMDTKQKLDKETEKNTEEEIQMEVLDPKVLVEVEIEETHMEENHYMKEAKILQKKLEIVFIIIKMLN